jgi:hypothetical protein
MHFRDFQSQFFVVLRGLVQCLMQDGGAKRLVNPTLTQRFVALGGFGSGCERY